MKLQNFCGKSFEPIGRVALNLNPKDSEFRERLEYYQSNKEEWKDVVKKQLEIYDKERSYIEPKGGEEIKRLILLVLPRYGEGMKLSHIREEVNKRSRRELSDKAIQYHLKNLEREGSVKKLGKGYYVQSS
jgi:hypothetical protein